MSWRDFLKSEKNIILPWLGGNLRLKERSWSLFTLPEEFGWYEFKIQNRSAELVEKSNIDDSIFINKKIGFLVGDRFIDDNSPLLSPAELLKTSKVNLIQEQLDKFVRVEVGQYYEDGPLVFIQQAFPLGPEDLVLDAFLNRDKDLSKVSGVIPSLEMAFRAENLQRETEEKFRAELERLRKEEEEKIKKEALLKEFREKTGTAVARRELAKVNFAEAASAALRLSGAEYLDHRPSYNKNETIVRFRLRRQRWECVVNNSTLRIIDSGICLVDHAHGNKKYDSALHLENLPAIIIDASDSGKLVRFRHP